MKMKSGTVVFFGNEKLATGITGVKPVIRQAITEAGFDIEKVITGKLSDLGEHTSKLAVLAAYGRLIPQSVLDEFPLGIINVHPSLLPAYRGPTPIEQAILDGATKTGVSIMRLTAGMDEGPIYKQKTIHLTGNESKAGLALRLQQLGSKLLVEVLTGIAGGTLNPRKQPHPSRATYSHLLTKEQGLINWHKTADQLEREIRAFAGWPKSRTNLGGINVSIIKATVVKMGQPDPGELRFDKKRLLVGTGQDCLEVLTVQPDGKKEMPIEAFLAGYCKLMNI
jgi:methionyl-tRNA formyltransferase